MQREPTPTTRLSAETATWSALVAALVLFAAVTFSTYRTVSGQRPALEGAERTRLVVRSSGRVLAAFGESQSLRRGYLLAGDTASLNRYRVMFEQAGRELATLDSLVRDDREQSVRVNRVAELLAQADSVGQATIRARQTGGLQRAADMVRAGGSQVIHTQLASTLGEIDFIEQRRLGGAIALARSRATQAQRIAIVSAILAAVLLPLAAGIIVRDLRQRRERSRAIRDASAAAQEATRAKSEFLASMSHEIRTPLNGVLGMIELLSDTDLSPRQRDYLQAARASANSLLGLLNDILDFSKIEAGRLELELAPFDLRDLIADTLRAPAIRAEQKGIRLRHHIAPSVPETLVGDAVRLQQILVNLVGNALKFTEEGEIEVSLEAAPLSSLETELHVAVRDTGIGIAPDRLHAVFELFTQGESSTHRRFGGTGLGLSISERLVHLLGGRIWVESTVGKGSTFHFTVRMQIAADDAPRPRAASDSRAATTCQWPGRRVLVAEDNVVNQRVVRGFLERRGVTVTIANNGQEALDLWTGADAFDLVLMDVEMPEIDGLEATRRIRAEEQRRADGTRLPIVALTAHAAVVHRARCFEAGMDECLTKPLRPAELDAVLGRFLPPGDATQPRQAAGEAPRPPLDASRDGQGETILRDMRELLGDDPALLRAIAGEFVRQTPALLSELRAAVSAQTPDAVARVAHRIKGAAAQVAATGMVAPAQRLEEAGRDGRLNGAEESLRDLEREAALAMTALARVERGA